MSELYNEYHEKFRELYDELCGEAHGEMIKALMGEVDDCEGFQLIYDLADTVKLGTDIDDSRIIGYLAVADFGKRFESLVKACSAAGKLARFCEKSEI